MTEPEKCPKRGANLSATESGGLLRFRCGSLFMPDLDPENADIDQVCWTRQLAASQAALEEAKERIEVLSHMADCFKNGPEAIHKMASEIIEQRGLKAEVERLRKVLCEIDALPVEFDECGKSFRRLRCSSLFDPGAGLSAIVRSWSDSEIPKEPPSDA